MSEKILKFRITNLAVELDDDRQLKKIIADYLKVDESKIKTVQIIRQTLDARRYRGAKIKFNYIVDVEIFGKVNFPREKNIKVQRKYTSDEGTVFEKILPCIKNPVSLRPVVIGFGPAGIFAALTLASAGLQPIIFERGENIDKRTATVEKFFGGDELDENSNIQFGEGGAGTFSDGKLTARSNDNLIDSVLKIFVESGAPKEILYLHKPHIGTDKLRTAVKNIRKKIIKLGGEIHFNSRLTDIEISGGKISAIVINDSEKIPVDKIFVGIGHSARDTYEMFFNRGIEMEIKPFAVGVRIEHPQEFINKNQFGEDFENPKLPNADYMLTFKDTETNRGAYSFCMCPGGVVVAATSEKNRVVTNGMSNFLRNSGVANSALLVTVGAEDFKNFGRDVLCGMRFQQHFENLAFELGGKNYFAPVQTVGDFFNARAESKNFLVNPTYPIGYKVADLHKCLPAEVSRTLENALKFFDSKIKNFSAADVPITGIETRTSSPCRILRDKISRESVNVEGFYPIGEGAGYAGGIMSSAIDGIKSAEKFLENLKAN